MSDNIPFEIQMDIIQRIPDSKWVIRCRSVSKEWKSVIGSKDFVTAHTLRHQPNNEAKPHHLLIRTQDFSDPELNYVSVDNDGSFINRKVSLFIPDSVDKFNDTPVKYVSVIDDDTFPHQKDNVFVPDSVKLLCKDAKIVGSSHGLFCLYDYESHMVVFWNPLIRKTVATAVPNMTRFGFGVCPITLDPKLVKIVDVYDELNSQNVNIGPKVEVFTLSSRAWRSPLSNIFPRESIGFGQSQVVIDGFIYWDAVDRIDMDDGIRYLIMSFDPTSEEFAEVNLPDRLALDTCTGLSVSNLRESLAVFVYEYHPQREIYSVWIMKGDDYPRSFEKLYTISARDESIDATLCFRLSGAPIIGVETLLVKNMIKGENMIKVVIGNDEYYYTPVALAIYEPESKSITNIGIHGLDGTISVHSYTETLLLLGH